MSIFLGKVKSFLFSRGKEAWIKPVGLSKARPFFGREINQEATKVRHQAFLVHDTIAILQKYDDSTVSIL
jgi:hypothetical protein